MNPKSKAGLFQTLEFVSTNSVIIEDQLHGRHDITEPVLVELLRSPALARLAGVCQHGITGLLGLTPRVTRLEHSIGAFLLVRNVGANLEEQIAGLLHDISHTVLSHVIDWALSDPGESFHEVHKARFLETTNLPEILLKHGFRDLKPLQEELFPLVETDAPHLCADRLDYALRDTVAFGKMTLEDARRILRSTKAHPDASSPTRMLVQQSEELALTLSRAYLAADRDVWSNPAHVDMSRRTGQLIGSMIRSGQVKEGILWNLSDADFWEVLRTAADAHGLEVIENLEQQRLSKSDEMPLPKTAKVRTLDPDVQASGTDEPTPLSLVSGEWAEERDAYILARKSIMTE